MALSKNAQDLLSKRYCHPGEKPSDVYPRVANALALGDSSFERKLTAMMRDGIFLPNSPCIRNAGFKKALLHACFVLGLQDSIEGISETLKNTILIFKGGGGVGINFSSLRPNNTPLSSGGTSSGVVSFMSLFDTATEVVKQGGFRRGALMGILDFNHPEIMEFIRSKLTGKLNNFNISVLINDLQMGLIERGEDIHLINPKDGNPIARVNAKTIWDVIAFSAWMNGDPGLLFYDRINKDNNLYPKVKIFTTNPCGEVTLPLNTACCLGSINLSELVRSGKFEYDKFKKYLELVTRALINNNKISWFPIHEITKAMNEYNPIGVGVMGYADALIKLGIYYDSQEALNFIDKIGEIYKTVTDKVGKGCLFRRSIAPTGSLSILADCSSGIEPIFDTVFTRNLTIGKIEETRDIYKSKFTRVAHEISPEWHLRVQAQWQKWTDNSISKTVNLPYEASIEDVKSIYMTAWKLGCKGVTVFRDGSKGTQVLVRQPKKQKCSDEECQL